MRVLFLLLLCPLLAVSQPLHFAWLSDTHVGSPTGDEDLRATIKDINSQSNLEFVIVSGDVTELGKDEEFELAKSIYDQCKIPVYLTPGNHDCKWSESGATSFTKFWGADKFVFNAGGYTFLAMHEGPVMKMGDGHFAPEDMRWLASTLKTLPPNRPLIFVTHYPLDDQLDNWYAGIDLLKQYNIQAVLVGHGHANNKLNFEGIPAAMGRSNLRAHEKVGGYTIVDVNKGKMTLTERNPGVGTKQPWHQMTLEKHDFASSTNKWPRPDYSVNKKYPHVKEKWQFDAQWLAAASPAIANNCAIVGDASGTVHALSLKNGKPKWEFQTHGPVYSSADASEGHVVFASCDGSIYSLDPKTGAKQWQYSTLKPIVASPRTANGKVFIGASDHKFRALDLNTGKLLWEFPDVGFYVESRPLVVEGKVIFGAWDEHLYALDANTGEPVWTWKGPHSWLNYSPAAYDPITAAGKVFIVAPDREMTAIDLAIGKQIWRTADYQVRETAGLASDKSRFYVRTMGNLEGVSATLAAFSTTANKPEKLWETNPHIGYDHNSAQIVEKDGVVFYGSKNGVVVALNAKTGEILWQHKLSNSIINTLAPLSARRVVATDFNGKTTLLEN
ncbi:MAG: WD40-like repeat protein [Verrucomicrobiales bacterium]|nr:WD40-like repeat protein [Verrucomicrobiales bacterium]